MKWYGSLGKWGQTAFFMAWFPAIVRLAEEAEEGTHYRIPTSLSGQFDSLEQLKSLAEIEQEREQKAADRTAAQIAQGRNGEPG